MKNGEALYTKAENVLRPRIWDSLLGQTQESRMREGLDLLEKAAQSFKYYKQWDRAAQTFEKAANIASTLKLSEVSDHYKNAFECYRMMDDPIKTEEMGNLAITNYKLLGKLNFAARVALNLGNYFSHTEKSKALKYYEKVLSFENKTSTMYLDALKLKEQILFKCNN